MDKRIFLAILAVHMLNMSYELRSMLLATIGFVLASLASFFDKPSGG